SGASGQPTSKICITRHNASDDDIPRNVTGNAASGDTAIDSSCPNNAATSGVLGYERRRCEWPHATIPEVYGATDRSGDQHVVSRIHRDPVGISTGPESLGPQ